MYWVNSVSVKPITARTGATPRRQGWKGDGSGRKGRGKGRTGEGEWNLGENGEGSKEEE